MSLADRLDTLARRLSVLPVSTEPPETIPQLLASSSRERDWQRLLLYFLDPSEPHGLDHDLLELLVDELPLTVSRLDLLDVSVASEVVTDRGRPDGLVWSSDEWFVLWELKMGAPEGAEQTRRYATAETFHRVDLDPATVSDEAYVYLAPREQTGPDDDRFVHRSWRWLASRIETLLRRDHGRYPARTTAQLEEFADTIRAERDMTEFQETQHEKVELFLDHYEAISTVQTAFEDRWDEFTQNWGDRLAERLDLTTIDDPDVPDDSLAVLVPVGQDERRWVFRQGHNDWAWLFPIDWWTDPVTGDHLYDRVHPNARVGFLHRLDRNRDDALGEQELRFYLRNAPSSTDAFYDGFAERFADDDDMAEAVPAATRQPGRKSNVLEATYEIDTAAHEDFFTAYVAALATALDEHACSNPALIAAIDRVYETTIAEDCRS